jgi:hypothetical protein
MDNFLKEKFEEAYQKYEKIVDKKGYVSAYNFENSLEFQDILSKVRGNDEVARKYLELDGIKVDSNKKSFEISDKLEEIGYEEAVNQDFYEYVDQKLAERFVSFNINEEYINENHKDKLTVKLEDSKWDFYVTPDVAKNYRNVYDFIINSEACKESHNGMELAESIKRIYPQYDERKFLDAETVAPKLVQMTYKLAEEIYRKNELNINEEAEMTDAGKVVASVRKCDNFANCEDNHFSFKINNGDELKRDFDFPVRDAYEVANYANARTGFSKSIVETADYELIKFEDDAYRKGNDFSVKYTGFDIEREKELLSQAFETGQEPMFVGNHLLYNPAGPELTIYKPKEDKFPYERNENKMLAKVTLKGIKTGPAYNSSNEKEVLKIAGTAFPNKVPKFKRQLDDINKNKKEKVANKNLKRN